MKKRGLVKNVVFVSIITVIGICMHFVCDIFSNETAVKILGIIFPVDECSWEHMKMFWYPFLFGGIYLSVKENDRSFFTSFVACGIAAMLFEVGVFTIYESFVLHTVLVIDVGTFILDYVICCIIALKIADRDWGKKYLWFWVAVAVAITAGIIYTTYNPGAGYIFMDNRDFNNLSIK